MFGFGSAQMGIGIAVHLEDRFSRNANTIALSMQRMQNRRDNLVKQAAQQYMDYSAKVSTAAGAVSYGLLEAMKVGATFEQKIQKVAIVSEGVLKRSSLRDLALKMSEEFRMAPIEVSEALFENVKAGVTENIDLITQYQLAVSKATGEMLEGQEGVAKGLLNIANSMQINYKHFAAVANATTVAANQTMASVNSLTEGMAYSANDFFQLYGGKTQESRIEAMSKNLAALGMLSQMGIEGSSAGVAVSNLLRYATTGSGSFATKRQQDALGMMGLRPSDLRDGQGNVMDMLDMLDLFAQRASKLSTGDQLDALFGLLGVRGKKGGINLMGADGRGVTVRGLYKSIQEGIKNDISIKQARQMMDTLQGDFDLAKVKWAQFLIQFTKAVEPLARKLVPMLSSVLGGLAKFMDTGLGKTMARVALVAAPIITVLFGLRAAALAATFALGNIGSMGGFRNIMTGALGTMGRAQLYGAGIARNAAGRYYVAAGRTFDYAGRTYRGGQILPRAALGLGSAASMANVGAGLARIAGIGGRIVGFLAGPWGLFISLGLTMLPMLIDWLSDNNGSEDEERMYNGYAPSGFEQYLPGYDPGRVDAFNRLGLQDMARGELKQKIEIFVNGEKSQEVMQTLSAEEQANILNSLNIDF